MSTIRFRHAAPAAVLLMLVSVAPFDSGGAEESRRPARRQAADGTVGAPKKQAAGAGGASRRPAASAEAAAPAEAKAPAATARADSGGTPAPGAVKSAAKPDSADGRARAAKVVSRAGADRDSSARRAQPERDEPKEDVQVRGPRLPIWPGISLANPSAGHEMLAAAW